ncbi:hypothetical protein JQR85_13700 [Stutzerimonas urumqiensis]|uniref:hypothetical protein n=1 Tax=Stutzerimonas urumqiensis TaxID=638269 RepID=UPI003DA214F1
MTTTAPVKSLADEQVEEIRHAVLTKPGQSLTDALGLPPETRFVDSGICSPMTIRRGRRAVECRRRCE